MAVLGLENGDSLLLWDGRSLNMDRDPQPVAGAFRRPVSRQGPWSRTKPLPGTQLNRSEPLTTGLVGYWPFNEGAGRAQDLVSGHHGIFSGGASWQNRNASFNGSTSVVTCAGAQSRLRALPLSITVWFQAASAHNGTLVQYAATSFSQWLKLSVTAGGSLIWAFAGTMATSTITAGTYTVGRWHCATALSRSDSLHELYLDGNLVGTSTTTVIYPTLNQCTFGYAYDWMMGWSENFSGQMAAVAVHARALSRTEIQALYSEPYRLFRASLCQFLPDPPVDATPTSISRQQLTLGNNPPSPGTMLDVQNPLARGLTSYWPLNEASGAVVLDHVRNKTGALSGASWRGGRLYLGGSPALVSVTGAEQGVRSFPISMSAWLKADSLHYGTILSLSSTSVSGYCYLGCDLSGVLAWSLGDTTTTTSLPGGSYQPGSWVHVVGVSRSAADHSLYVNGQLVTSSTGALATFPSLNTATMGAVVDSGGAGQYFRGQLGPCAVYNRALLPDEISSLSRQPFALLASRPRYLSLPIPPSFPQTILLSSVGVYSISGLEDVSPGTATVSPKSGNQYGIVGDSLATTTVAVGTKSVASTEIFGEATAIPGDVVVDPVSIATAEAISNALLSTIYQLSVAGVLVVESFGDPDLSTGTVSLSPAAVSDHRPTGNVSTTTAYTLSPTTVTTTFVGGNVSTTTGSVSLLPETLSSVAGTGNEEISYNYTVSPHNITTEEQVGESARSSTVTVTAKSVYTAEHTGLGSVSSLYTVTALGFVSGDVSVPTLVIGGVTLLPTTITSTSESGKQSLIPGSVSVNLIGVYTTEVTNFAVVAVLGTAIRPKGVTEAAAHGILSTTTGVVVVTPRSSEPTTAVGQVDLSTGSVTVYARSVETASSTGNQAAVICSITLTQQSIVDSTKTGHVVLSSNRTTAVYGAASELSVSTTSISRVVLVRSTRTGESNGNVIVTRFTRTITVQGIAPASAVGLSVVLGEGGSAEGAGFQLEVFINPVDTLF